MISIPVIALVLMLATSVVGDESNEADLNAKRAADLKTDVKDFQLGLSYLGQSRKPYYKLLLSVPQVSDKQADAFFLVAQISEDDARKIIAHLEETDMLGRAVEKAEAAKLPEPLYRLTVIERDTQLSTSLGWDREMLKSLDELRMVLNGDAAKKMDMLLGRLSGHRREWDAAK